MIRCGGGGESSRGVTVPTRTYHSGSPVRVGHICFGVIYFVGVWCNGSILALGASSPSSNLGTPTK